MALIAITPLCSQTDVEQILSVAGVKVRLDENMDGYVSGTEQAKMTTCISMGSETCYFYLYSKYDPSWLVQSPLVNRWAAVLSAYQLAGFCANPLPSTLVDWAEDAEKKMEEVFAGRKFVPQIPLRRTQAPVWDNVRVDPRYIFKCIRVERQRSSQQPNALPVAADWDEAFTWEI